VEVEVEERIMGREKKKLMGAERNKEARRINWNEKEAG
jgi:hypothetical protein